MKSCRFVLISIIALSLFCFPQITRAAGTVTDCSAYTAPGGLQEALTGGGTITFACSGTIIVPEITITGTVTIDGTGQNVVLSGNNANRVFTVPGGNLSLIHITVANGRALSGGGIAVSGGGTLTVTDSNITNNVLVSGEGGGGIYNGGSSVTIVGSNITGNRAIGSAVDSGGGGILTYGGDLTVTGSTFSDNSGKLGGAVHSSLGANTVISSSVFSGNFAEGTGGGAIYSIPGATIRDSSFFDNRSAVGGGAILGHADISGSTFARNSAEQGGAIDGGILTIQSSSFVENSANNGGAIYLNSGPSTISNNTFSGNTAGNLAGAVYIGVATVTINNSTFAGNSAAAGSSIWIHGSLDVSLTLLNSLLAQGVSGANCVQGPESQLSVANTIISDGSCGGLAVDPLLGPLADNGGPTLTHMPQPGSPAIDAGDNATCETVDQRGVPRPVDGDGDGIAVCDMGAVEAPFTNVPLDEPSAEDNARAQSPLLALLGGGTNPIVRADVPDGTITNGSVFGRVLVENGTFVVNPAEIGNQELLDMGVIQAVDIFGMDHNGQSVTTFNSSIKVCLLGSGRFFFLDANQSPRVPSLLPSTYENGYTCATIYSAGMVVLVH